MSTVKGYNWKSKLKTTWKANVVLFLRYWHRYHRLCVDNIQYKNEAVKALLIKIFMD